MTCREAASDLLETCCAGSLSLCSLQAVNDEWWCCCCTTLDSESCGRGCCTLAASLFYTQGIQHSSNARDDRLASKVTGNDRIDRMNASQDLYLVKY